MTPAQPCGEHDLGVELYSEVAAQEAQEAQRRETEAHRNNPGKRHAEGAGGKEGAQDEQEGRPYFGQGLPFIKAH